jgi:serine/threonine protein kinase
MDKLIGEYLGRYHILEQLGEGGMATVYKAFDTRLEREVAIKIIIRSRQQSPEFLKRFDREAKALARLSHPNVAKVMDYGEHKGIPYLVMEYLPGGTLKSRLGAPMAWASAARLLAPVASALGYAHERGIVHRDVKPSNILIAESGEPMLSDFGIAKILETEETWDVTGTGVGIGTPEYMAPEQGMGRVIDHRADVYALGIVLYELVTGRTPFHADTPLAVLLKQINDPVPAPGEFASNLPSGVEQVIFKALAKDPGDRYQSMREFEGALRRLAEGERHAIEAKTRIGLEHRRFPKNAGPAILVVAAIAVAVVAGMPSISQLKLTESVTSGGPVLRPSITPQIGPEVGSVGFEPTRRDELALATYDDFSGSGQVDPLRWWSDTDFRLEDGTAVLEAVTGQESSNKANLDATNRWSPTSSGRVRFSVETRIRVDSGMAQYRGHGSTSISLNGPPLEPEGSWYFETGYVFESGHIGYECAGGRWIPSLDGPPAMYSQIFGVSEFGQWNVFRASIEEAPAGEGLELVAYVNEKDVCHWRPPAEWQEAVGQGEGVSLYLLNDWSGAWEGVEPFSTYFDYVRVGPISGK